MESKNKKGRRRRRTLDQNFDEFAQLLPDEIIFNILPRLPITSVLQCRCVCKTWLSIVCDPQFAYAHLAFAQSTGTDPSIILWSRTFGIPKDGLNKMYLVEPHTFKIFNEINWIPKFCDSSKIQAFEVVGSCNGFICLAQSYDSGWVYVCNPLTRQSMALPPSAHRPWLHESFGFGFTSNTKEYKVVRMLPIEGDSHTGVGISQVEVYTLDTEYWRIKDTIPYWLDFNFHWNTFLNGALHWFSVDNGDPNMMHNKVLVSFDVGDEEFRVIPHPDFDPIDVGPNSRYVGVTEGYLSIHDYYTRGRIEIWIMKDYGVKESWSKCFVFSEDHNFFYPLDMRINGETILGYCEAEIPGHWLKKLVTYDVGSRIFTDLQLHGIPDFNLVYPYMASLITLESACGGEKMSIRERKKIRPGMMSSYVSTRSRSKSKSKSKSKSRCSKM